MVLVLAIMTVSFVAQVQAAKSTKLEVRVHRGDGSNIKGATVNVYDVASGALLRTGTTKKKGFVKFKCIPYGTLVNVTATYGGITAWQTVELIHKTTNVEIEVPI